MVTRDIAATAAKLLLDTSWSGQGGVAVLGPQDVSLNDMADTMSDVLGKPIRLQPISIEEFQAQLRKSGASETRVQGLTDMQADIGYRAGDASRLSRQR